MTRDTALVSTFYIYHWQSHGAGGAGPGERGGGWQPRHGRHQRQGGRVRQVNITERQFLGCLHDHLNDQ